MSGAHSRSRRSLSSLPMFSSLPSWEDPLLPARCAALLVYGEIHYLRSDCGGDEEGQSKPESWNDGEPYEGESPRDLDVDGSELKGMCFHVLLSFSQSYRVVYVPDGDEVVLRFSKEERVKTQAFFAWSTREFLSWLLKVLWIVIEASLSTRVSFGIGGLVKQNPKALVTGTLLCLSDPEQNCKALVSGHQETTEWDMRQLVF
ncbi:hypothetical protein Bca101_004682 [Brassica carinata]